MLLQSLATVVVECSHILCSEPSDSLPDNEEIIPPYSACLWRVVTFDLCSLTAGQCAVPD